MKLLIDTNIILDVLLKRQPFYENAAKVLKLAAREDFDEFVSASAITDIYYIAQRTVKDKEAAKNLLNKLVQVVSVAAVSEDEINHALGLNWEDFEDSVQYSVALSGNMDGVVTRNLDDYRKSELPIWSPEQLLEKYLNA